MYFSCVKYPRNSSPTSSCCFSWPWSPAKYISLWLSRVFPLYMFDTMLTHKLSFSKAFSRPSLHYQSVVYILHCQHNNEKEKVISFRLTWVRTGYIPGHGLWKSAIFKGDIVNNWTDPDNILQPNQGHWYSTQHYDRVSIYVNVVLFIYRRSIELHEYLWHPRLHPSRHARPKFFLIIPFLINTFFRGIRIKLKWMPSNLQKIYTLTIV